MQTLAHSVMKPGVLSNARGDFHAALYGSKLRKEIAEEAHRFLEKTREQKKLPRILQRSKALNRKKKEAQPVEPVEQLQPVELVEPVDKTVPMGVTKLPQCLYMCVRPYVPTPKTHIRRARLPFDCLTFLALHNSNGRLVRESVIYAFVDHYFPSCRTIKNDAWMNCVRRELMQGKEEFIMFSNPGCRGNKGDVGAFWALAEDVERIYARKLTRFCQSYKNISQWGIANLDDWNEILAGLKGYPKEVEESSLKFDMVTLDVMQKPGFWQHNERIRARKECPTCEEVTSYARMMEKKRTSENMTRPFGGRKEKVSEPPAKRAKLTKNAEYYTGADGLQYCYENETTSGELSKEEVEEKKERQYYAIKTDLTYNEIKKEKTAVSGEYYFDEDEIDENDEYDILEGGYVHGEVSPEDPMEYVEYCEQQYMAPMEQMNDCNLIEEYIPSEEFHMHQCNLQQEEEQLQAGQQMQQLEDVRQMQQQPHFGEQQNFHDMPVLSQQTDQHYFMNSTENHFPSSASSPDSGFFSQQGDGYAMEAAYGAQIHCSQPQQTEFPPLEQFVFKDNNSAPMSEETHQNTLPLGEYDGQQQSWMSDSLFSGQETNFMREENCFDAMSNCFDAFDEFFPQLSGAPVM